MSTTQIEWADLVWNPIVGCSIVSPGCANCYAMRQAARIERMDKARGGNVPHYHGLTRYVNGNPVWTGIVRPAPERVMRAPLSWRKPARVFVNSMSDLFHEDVPDFVIDQVFAVMALCPHLTFIIVTKRSERMRAYLTAMQRAFEAEGDEFTRRWGHAAVAVTDAPCAASTIEEIEFPLPNVWLLVSAERQIEADERIPDLLATPAAKRGVSLEPLIGPIKLHYLQQPGGMVIDALKGEHWYPGAGSINSVTRTGKPKLDWVITGFENGPRPGHPDWVRDVRDQCATTNTAFFHKQNGTWRVVADLDKDDPGGGRAEDIRRTTPKGQWLNRAGGHGFHGDRVLRVVPTTKARAGAELDGEHHREFPR